MASSGVMAITWEDPCPHDSLSLTSLSGIFSRRYFLESSARTVSGVKASSADSMSPFTRPPFTLPRNSSTQAYESTRILNGLLLYPHRRTAELGPCQPRKHRPESSSDGS